MLGRTMLHIFIAQAILVWIFVLWPMLSKLLDWLNNRYLFSNTIDDVTDDATSFEHEKQFRQETFRGKWRDFEGQDRTTSQSSHRASMGTRAPLTPREAHLKTLGLDQMADAKTLRKAYRRLAKKWHPDRFAAGDHSDADRDMATDKMGQINEAYDWLIANPL